MALFKCQYTFSIYDHLPTWQNWGKLQVKLEFSIQNWGKLQVKLEFCHVGGKINNVQIFERRPSYEIIKQNVTGGSGFQWFLHHNYQVS